jgi:GAF domain-containing protein
MTPPTTDSTGPVLDEATFQKLLAAAYTLQEHNERVRTGTDSTSDKKNAPAVDSDTTAALAQIVDAQHQIHANDLDLTGAMNLIVDRIRKITGAQGAAIGLIEQEKVRYRACSGTLVPTVETTLRSEAAISASALLHDVLLGCTDAHNDFRINPEVARRLGIQSLIAVPIFHDGKTAGALELVFSKPGAFQEHDVRTCQLMAGLVTEALTHEAQKQWRQGVAAERASMLEVLERIKPQLARLASTPAGTERPEASTPETNAQLPENPDDSICKHCGSEMAPAEVFCGSCGTSRSSVSRKDLQSKWATLWNLQKVSGQQASNESRPHEAVIKPLPESKPYESVIKPLPETKPYESVIKPPAESKPYESVIKPSAESKPYESVIKPLPESEPYESVIQPLAESGIIKPETLPRQLSEPPSALPAETTGLVSESASSDSGHSVDDQPLSSNATSETTTTQSSVPTEQGLVAKAEDPVLLHSIATSPPPTTRFGAFWEKHKDFIKKHPGDLALGAAASLFLITILWAVSSNNPTTSADSGAQQGATTTATPVKPKRKQAPPPPKLSFFDQVLVGLGLADPPPAPTYTGNPDVPVWIDVHTALYYCPGADLYGKTPQGKIASQRDAQMDQFEPASRKVCD